jgi:two-component system, LuxR family, response regulator DctR
MATAPPMPPKRARIHIVMQDDAPREALLWLFASHQIGARGWVLGTDLLAALPVPDIGCILFDTGAEVPSGVTFHNRLRAAGCDAPMIFLTDPSEGPDRLEPLRSIAFGLVEKPCRAPSIVDLALTASQMHTVRQSDAMLRKQVADRLAALSPHEAQVIGLMLQGRSTVQIADHLDLPPRKVEVHGTRILSKLDVRSTADLAALLRTLPDPATS